MELSCQRQKRKGYRFKRRKAMALQDDLTTAQKILEQRVDTAGATWDEAKATWDKATEVYLKAQDAWGKAQDAYLEAHDAYLEAADRG